MDGDIPPAADPVEIGRMEAEANFSANEEIIDCPTCHNPRRRFLIVNDQCDSCRTKGPPLSRITVESCNVNKAKPS